MTLTYTTSTVLALLSVNAELLTTSIPDPPLSFTVNTSQAGSRTTSFPQLSALFSGNPTPGFHSSGNPPESEQPSPLQSDDDPDPYQGSTSFTAPGSDQDSLSNGSVSSGNSTLTDERDQEEATQSTSASSQSDHQLFDSQLSVVPVTDTILVSVPIPEDPPSDPDLISHASRDHQPENQSSVAASQQQQITARTDSSGSTKQPSYRAVVPTTQPQSSRSDSSSTDSAPVRPPPVADSVPALGRDEHAMSNQSPRSTAPQRRDLADSSSTGSDESHPVTTRLPPKILPLQSPQVSFGNTAGRSETSTSPAWVNALQQPVQRTNPQLARVILRVQTSPPHHPRTGLTIGPAARHLSNPHHGAAPTDHVPMSRSAIAAGVHENMAFRSGSNPRGGLRGGNGGGDVPNDPPPDPPFIALGRTSRTPLQYQQQQLSVQSTNNNHLPSQANSSSSSYVNSSNTRSRSPPLRDIVPVSLMAPNPMEAIMTNLLMTVQAGFADQKATSSGLQATVDSLERSVEETRANHSALRDEMQKHHDQTADDNAAFQSSVLTSVEQRIADALKSLEETRQATVAATAEATQRQLLADQVAEARAVRAEQKLADSLAQWEAEKARLLRGLAEEKIVSEYQAGTRTGMYVSPVNNSSSSSATAPSVRPPPPTRPPPPASRVNYLVNTSSAKKTPATTRPADVLPRKLVRTEHGGSTTIDLTEDSPRIRLPLDGNPTIRHWSAAWLNRRGEMPVETFEGRPPAGLPHRNSDPNNHSLRADFLPGRMSDEDIAHAMNIPVRHYYDIMYRLIPNQGERMRSLIRHLPLQLTARRRGALQDLLLALLAGSEWPPQAVRVWQGRFLDHYYRVEVSSQHRGGYGLVLREEFNDDLSMSPEEREELAAELQEVIMNVDLLYEGLLFRGTIDDLDRLHPGHSEFALRIHDNLFIDAFEWRGLTSRINFALNFGPESDGLPSASFIGNSPGVLRLHAVAKTKSALQQLTAEHREQGILAENAPRYKIPNVYCTLKRGQEVLLTQRAGKDTDSCSSTVHPRLNLTQELLIALYSLQTDADERYARAVAAHPVSSPRRSFSLTLCVPTLSLMIRQV
eukprot:gene28997-35965_t